MRVLNGHIAAKELPDGRLVALCPLLWGNISLTIGDYNFVNESYTYDSLTRAQQAFGEYDGTVEPLGWFRSPTSGRRRPNGDPEQEYVHW